jgi:hypothetical protein
MSEHLKAVTNLTIATTAAGVSWMTQAEHLIHLAASIVAICSGISATVYYIKSIIHKKWKE